MTFPLRSVGAIALALLSSACASTGAVPRPFPVPGPTARPPSAGGEAAAPAAATSAPELPPSIAVDTYALVGTALDLRGIPYRNGGSDPRGFDCSGFTQYVFAQFGIALPREVRDQFSIGGTVTSEELQPGDLLFFSTTSPGATHVGIAIGGDAFVHAPSSTGVVRVERLGSAYWSRRFIGGRRVI